MQEYNYFFARLIEISNQKRIELITRFKSPKKVYEKSEKELLKTGIVNLYDIQKLNIQKKERPLSDYEEFKKSGIRLVTFFDLEYPPGLRFIYDAPFALFVKGKLPQNFSNAIAMVGARKCTAYGRVAAEDIAKILAKNGALIVSGMARGIDGISHAAALSGGAETVAVLGCGVDVCYPSENKTLYENIIKKGAVISEYPPKTPPISTNFPLRNRIISGISRALIVIEAKEKSGTLITADFALDQGRDIYALPGRINDVNSAGCNNLIKEGAGIINSAEGLLNDFFEAGILGEYGPDKTRKTGAKERLKGKEKVVYDALDYYAVSLDEIITKTSLSLNEVIEAVESMEQNGMIKKEGKNSFVKNKL